MYLYDTGFTQIYIFSHLYILYDIQQKISTTIGTLTHLLIWNRLNWWAYYAYGRSLSPGVLCLRAALARSYSLLIVIPGVTTYDPNQPSGKVDCSLADA